jgi:hypothetical protein
MGIQQRVWLVVLALIMIGRCLPVSSILFVYVFFLNSIPSKRRHVGSAARKTIEKVTTAATIQTDLWLVSSLIQLIFESASAVPLKIFIAS